MIKKLNKSQLPEDLTAESVFYACDGPKEQQIEALLRIRRLCSSIRTEEAKQLLQEAVEALAALEN
jgi:hypothetical protein